MNVAKRDRLACWLCNLILNHMATAWYRKMVGGSIRYGLLAATEDERDGMSLAETKPVHREQPNQEVGSEEAHYG